MIIAMNSISVGHGAADGFDGDDTEEVGIEEEAHVWENEHDDGF